MASQVISSLARLATANPPGVKRSRFSLHFSTPRMRRWLLVQLVSVPTESAGEQKVKLPQVGRDHLTDGDHYNRLLNDYQNEWMWTLKRCG